MLPLSQHSPVFSEVDLDHPTNSSFQRSKLIPIKIQFKFSHQIERSNRSIMAGPPSTPMKSDSVITVTSLPTEVDDPLTIQLSPPKPVPNDGNLLIVSPYHELPHLLDLRTLDTANQLLAKALVRLECLRDDYATAPYTEIFNWSEVIETVKDLTASISNFQWKEQAFYIVVFRSRIPPTTAYADLGVLDKAAHAEATESGGFLK